MLQPRIWGFHYKSKKNPQQKVAYQYVLSLWRDWRASYIGLELDHFFPSIEAKMSQIKRKHHRKCDKQNELKNSQGDF